MNPDFWKIQDPQKPLFPDVLWSKPERKTGALAVVGGNARGFAAVAAAEKTARETGVSEVRIILPDVLKSKIPLTNPDIIFAKSNPSGGFAKAASAELNAAANFANAILFVGDSGANSETAMLIENFLRENREIPVVLTRDAVDLILHSAENVLNRENTQLILSLSQLQKLTRAVYYPRVVTFSQGVRQMAETLHKFTTTYPLAVTLWHAGNLLFAKNGAVISQKFDQPLSVWSGEIATREAVWALWHKDVAKAVASAWVEM